MSMGVVNGSSNWQSPIFARNTAGAGQAAVPEPAVRSCRHFRRRRQNMSFVTPRRRRPGRRLAGRRLRGEHLGGGGLPLRALGGRLRRERHRRGDGRCRVDQRASLRGTAGRPGLGSGRPWASAGARRPWNVARPVSATSRTCRCAWRRWAAGIRSGRRADRGVGGGGDRRAGPCDGGCGRSGGRPLRDRGAGQARTRSRRGRASGPRRFADDLRSCVLPQRLGRRHHGRWIGTGGGRALQEPSSASGRRCRNPGGWPRIRRKMPRSGAPT